MTLFNTTCLYTSVQNISGTAMTFGFLGAHGKTLAKNAVYTTIGTIDSEINRHHFRGKRQLQAWEKSIKNSQLLLQFTPRVILFDDTLDTVKQLDLNNGSLSAVSPCWNTSAGS